MFAYVCTPWVRVSLLQSVTFDVSTRDGPVRDTSGGEGGGGSPFPMDLTLTTRVPGKEVGLIRGTYGSQKGTTWLSRTVYRP